MRATSGVMLLAVLAPLACGAPEPPTAPTAAPNAIIFPNVWLRADLPFVPAGINDSGAIVGSINNTGVRSLNGTLTTLPAPPGRIILAAVIGPSPVFHPPYAATAIANTGHIAGSDGNLLVWTSLTQTPQELNFGLTIVANAINDGDMVVGTAGGSAFRWTRANGFQRLLPPTGWAAPVAMVVNDNGYVAGFAEPVVAGGPEVLVRWDPSGNVTFHLPLNNTLPENRPAGINAAGDVLSTSGNTTYIWSVGGATTIVSGVPTLTRTEGWSSLGRIIGHTIGGDNHPWTFYQGGLTFLPQPTPADEADIPVGVNTCGTIVARRVNNDVQLDSGYVWRHSLFCDQLGQTLPVAAQRTGVALH